jgi:hypothetical protein
MIPLNNKIVAYLTINNINYTSRDYQTGHVEGEPDGILTWNVENLGPEPTQGQLNTAYTTYQSNIDAEEKAKTDIKASALAKLAALGLTEDEIKSITGG